MEGLRPLEDVFKDWIQRIRTKCRTKVLLKLKRANVNLR
jgi:hypothetical protein